jgi:hypothetical protein
MRRLWRVVAIKPIGAILSAYGAMPAMQGQVPYSALLRAGGLAGIICPSCKIELAPNVWTNAVALAVAIPVSITATNALRSSGLAWYIPLLGLLLTNILTFALVSWVGWVSVVRLRQRSDRSRPLGPL